MRPASFQPASRRRRAIAFALALLAEALVIILLLTLAPRQTPRRAESDTKTFSFAPAPAARKAAKPAPHHTAQAKHATVAPPPPHPPRLPPPPITLPGVLPLSLAKNDITGIRSAPDADSADAGDSGSGKDSGSAYGPGEGPGGERLYNAEWYREPTDAELSAYLPKTGAPPEGWALIACQTVPDYKVENCRDLGESPLGSGLARAMRQAAWQFRVLPPRVGGHKMIGAWVRIRIDFTVHGVK